VIQTVTSKVERDGQVVHEETTPILPEPDGKILGTVDSVAKSMALEANGVRSEFTVTFTFDPPLRIQHEHSHADE
jgi:hypothetical protein